jgi:lysozyme
MMTPEMFARLRHSLIAHEDLRKFPYEDTKGKITIGIGYNLTDRGIDEEWINEQFVEDVIYFHEQFCEFPWFLRLNEDRQIVLIDMAFMGWKRFLEFKELIKALELGDFKKASYEMLDSNWAKEVKGRANSLAKGMLTGVYDI